VAAIGLLHVVPLRAYTAKVEKSVRRLARRRGVDRIDDLPPRADAAPARGERIGRQGPRRQGGEGPHRPRHLTLFGEKLAINSIELDNVSLNADAVRRIPRWGSAERKGGGGGIERIACGA
jgi:hypothetical protein